MWSRPWRRIRRLVIEKILHLDDTPHRIAFGVFLGFVVGWTPTLGAQILIYWVMAYILRANRASGLLPVFLTNPITAVPIYLFNWKVGQWLLHGASGGDASAAEEQARLEEMVEQFSLSRMFEAEFWSSLWPTLAGLGIELLVGCLAVGFACGTLGYVVTFYGVISYRRRRQAKLHGQSARADRPGFSGAARPADIMD